MGLFSGPRITQPQTEERATYMAPHAQMPNMSYADTAVTSSSAAQSVAIRTTADLIASMGSELPITVYTGSKSSRREVPVPASLEDPGGDDSGREDWAYRLMWSWLLAGNAFGDVIDRDGARLRTVDLFNPEKVTATLADGKVAWAMNGKPVEAGRLKHWRVNPMPGHLFGLSPIEHHATTIGTSLATSRFGRQWFVQGAHPSGLLYNEIAAIDAEEAQAAKDRVALTRGSNDPMVFGKGWKWENVQISPEESQFLQTQGLSEAQCARIFGPGFAEILGYETGSKMTYTNIVDRRQDLLVFAMNRWLRRYERVLSAFTPRPQWVEVNRDAMLESTTIQRFQAHALALTNQWRTVNEIRKIEHLDPVPWGDVPIANSTAPAAQTQESDDESDPGA